MSLMSLAAVVVARHVGSRRATRICKRVYPVYSFLKHRERHFFNRIAIEHCTWCNRTCHYCPYGNGIKAPEIYMSDQLFDTVTWRIAELGWSEVVAFGIFGEPLSDERIVQLVKHLKDRNPKCYPIIYSNGDFATEKLVGELIDAGLWRIGFTQHPPSNDRWKQNIGAIQKKYPYHVGWQVIPEDKLCNHAGLVPTIEAVQGPCFATESFPIRVNGDVGLCCSDQPKRISFGNVKDQGLVEIWRQPRYAKIRENLRKGVRQLDMCKKCKVAC